MSDEREDDDADSEEFNWSEAESRARMFDHIAEVMKRISERKYVPVQLAGLTKGSRFVVTTYSDGHDPLDCTLLDPATGTVAVHDNFYFTEPTTCVLFGSDDDLDGNGAMLPAVIKHNAKLVFHVNGQRIEENGHELRVMRLSIHLAGTRPFDPWGD